MIANMTQRPYNAMNKSALELNSSFENKQARMQLDHDPSFQNIDSVPTQTSPNFRTIANKTLPIHIKGKKGKR
jgi:hypothetical protein